MLALIASSMMGLGLVVGASRDASIFTFIGERLFAGAVPYRDLWDHKPPVIYLIDGLGALLGGWPGVWVLTVLAIVAAGLAIRKITRSDWSAFLAVAILGAYPISLGGGMTETFAAAAAAWAFAARGPILSGVLAGGALVITPQVWPVVPVLVLQYRKAWRRLLLGACAVPAVVLVWLAVAGALPQAVDQVITYNRAYLTLDRSVDIGRSLVPLVGYLSPLLLGALLAVRISPKPDWWNRAALWSALALLSIALEARLFTHYGAVLVVPLSLMAAPAISAHAGRLARLVMAATAVLAITSSGLWGITQLHAHGNDPPAKVVAWIQEHTRPSDPILVWGLKSEIYLAAGRPAAGGVLDPWPLTTPGYSTTADVQAFVSRLELSPPVVIVDGGGNSALPFAPPPPGTPGGRTLDYLTPLRRFVATHYVVAGHSNHMTLYLRR